MSGTFHIAQVNIERMLAPLDDPLLAGFVARLEEINALAESSSGFVWRLATAAGDATSLRPDDDDRILFNLSAWESPEQLRDFIYRNVHVEVMRQRKSWFERFDAMYYALWWVAAGDIPSIEEAKERLEYLRTHGASAQAFSFANLYPAPDAADPRPRIGFAGPCAAA
jgi:Domain of unknown function (DUF3291)